MDLDQPQFFHKIDRENMLEPIQGLPNQLELAWRLGMNFELPELKSVSQILIAGMGGSAIGGDLITAYIRHISSVPVIVYRDYGLPDWAKQPGSLVVASSHSGNTEETLSAYREARKYSIQRMVICTGGKLAEMAREDGCGIWQFEHHGQPRSAVGFSFGLLLALLCRLGLAAGQEKAIHNALSCMKLQQAGLEPEQPILKNPAKQMALRFSDKFPVLFGADLLAPVARRWKGQINELAKHWAQAEEIPEADHNLLAGSQYPQLLQVNMKFVFLSASTEHERNKLRVKLTHDILREKKLDAEIFEAAGEDALSNLWTTLHFGDYLAYYMALIKNVDPTPIEVMTGLKKALQNYK